MAPFTSEKKLTILICTFNRAHLLPGCLQALLDQDQTALRETDVWVVDNGSTDNTRETALRFSRFFPHFQYVYEDKQGLSHARNRGLEAEGAYLAYLDDDARVTPNWLGHLLAIIDTHNPDMVGGPVLPLPDQSFPPWLSPDQASRCTFPRTGWITSGHLAGTNFAIRKSLLLEYGGFDPSLGMKGAKIEYGEDTAIVDRGFADGRKIYYDNGWVVNDLLPEYKKSFLFHLHKWYHSGFFQGKSGRVCQNEAQEELGTSVARVFSALSMAIEQARCQEPKADSPEQLSHRELKRTVFQLGVIMGQQERKENA